MEPILMRTSSRRQAGFTMVELMVTMVLTAILVFVVFHMLIQAQDMAATMIQRVRFNQEARQLFEMTANGGFVDLGSDGVDARFPDERIPGLRGGSGLNSGSTSTHYRGYQWNTSTTQENTANVLLDTELNRLSLRATQDLSGSTGKIQSSAHNKLSCTGLGTPSPDCPAGTAQDMGILYNGRVDTAIRHGLISGTGRLAQVRFQLVDPDNLVDGQLFDPLPADDTTYLAIPWSQREEFRATFYLMGDY